MKARWLYRAVRIAVIVVASVTIFGFVVKALWNGLMPPIFGWHTITYWQGVGLLVLSKIFFGGGFRGRSGGGMSWRRRMGERWEKMSPEEREQFSKGMRGCFGRRDFRPQEQKV